MRNEPPFFFKKWEGWGIQLAPSHTWSQGQNQVGMAQAPRAACKSHSSTLGSAKPNSTQLSLLPTRRVPSCQVNECSAENGHLFAVWCNSFSFLHTQNFYWLQGENKWGQEENQEALRKAVFGHHMQQAKIPKPHYLLTVETSETPEWRKFLWRKARWSVYLNFLLRCKLAPG